MSHTFQVGDRVRCVVAHENRHEAVGRIGTVHAISVTGSGSVGVKFDENIHGHNLNGNCDNGHGWWFAGDRASECLEPFHEVPDSPIEIDEDAWAEFLGGFIHDTNEKAIQA